jgi:hypothetical protein
MTVYPDGKVAENPVLREQLIELPSSLPKKPTYRYCSVLDECIGDDASMHV